MENAFHTQMLYSPIGLCNMLKHLHLHIFISEVDSQFLSTFMDYYNGHVEYSNAFLSLQMWEDIARAQVSPRVIYCHDHDLLCVDIFSFSFPFPLLIPLPLCL